VADRLSLANALADAKLDRSAAERIATEIFEAIHDSVATKNDPRELEQRHGARIDQLSEQRLETHIDQFGKRLEARIDQFEQRLKAEMALLEHHLLIRLGGLMIVLVGLLFGGLRYLPPVH
jgi:hypothetical protein